MVEIDAVFDRLTEALPKYVPAMPSILFGLRITIGIVTIGLLLCVADMFSQRNSEHVFMRMRGILLVVLASVLAYKAGAFFKEKHYLIQCITLNKQHYANLHWLKQYIMAARG